MVNLSNVETMIKAQIPDAKVYVRDLTGGGDHLEAVVISDQFANQSKVKQHQMVYRALQTALDSEAIHALALKTYTPEAFQKSGLSV